VKVRREEIGHKKKKSRACLELEGEAVWSMLCS
jgi:hypothetical protein